MLKQYALLTHCINDLKLTPLPLLEKLKLEVKLIQTKRLLLEEDIGAKVKGVPSSEADFHELRALIQRAGAYDNGGQEAVHVASHLARIMEGLKALQQCKEYRSDRARGFASH